ncbi:MAG: class I SAM-dependent methyltransferase [Myxococcales bacterium]|nr:class I SAM-dependent methyltransferase [Myxococcales bacterium]
MIVTTAASGDPAEADDLARRFGLRAEPRAGRTLIQVLADAEGPVLVLAARRADLYENGRAFRATAGMAALRLLRARRGEPDPLVAAAALKPGETVLDATLGLGNDALLAAQATGTNVVGLEVDGVLAAFAQAALTRLPADPAGRIEIVNADHREWLRTQPPRAYDVVLLDPMFRKAGDAGPLFELLRAHAGHAPLDEKTLHEARRVARRGVLVKDAAPGDELRRLGLTPRLSRRSAAIAFGWAESLTALPAG